MLKYAQLETEVRCPASDRSALASTAQTEQVHQSCRSRCPSDQVPVHAVTVEHVDVDVRVQQRSRFTVARSVRSAPTMRQMPEFVVVTCSVVSAIDQPRWRAQAHLLSCVLPRHRRGRTPSRASRRSVAVAASVLMIPPAVSLRSPHSVSPCVGPKSTSLSMRAPQPQLAAHGSFPPSATAGIPPNCRSGTRQTTCGMRSRSKSARPTCQRTALPRPGSAVRGGRSLHSRSVLRSIQVSQSRGFAGSDAAEFVL